MIMIQTAGGTSAEGDAGGGVLHGIQLARYWSAQGHDVHFITNANDNGTKVYEGIDNLYRIPSPNNLGLGSVLGTVQSELIGYFMQRGPFISLAKRLLLNRGDAVAITLSPSLSDVLIALNLARKLSIPSIVYIHHVLSPPWRHPFRRGGLLRVTFNWTTSILSLLLIKLGGLLPCIDHPNELTGIGWKFSTGIMEDPDFLDRPTPESSTSERLCQAAFIGRISPNKGVIDAIKAWKIVTKTFPSARLLIMGKCYLPNFKGKIKRLIEKLNLHENVRVSFGYVDQETKERILRDSLIFLFPSYEEGWSLSVMEAAAFGAVPVTYDLGAYSYLGDSAVKAAIGDFKALSSELIRLIKDPILLQSKSEALRGEVARFRLQDVAEMQLQHIRDFHSSFKIRN